MIRSVVCDECWAKRGKPEERTCVCGTLVVTCADCGRARELGVKPYWHCLRGLEPFDTRAPTT